MNPDDPPQSSSPIYKLTIHQIAQIPLRHQHLLRPAFLAPIPAPALDELGIQHPAQQIRNVFADDGQKFPAVEATARGDVEAWRGGVGGDDEVLVGGEGVPGLVDGGLVLGGGGGVVRVAGG